MKTDHQKTSEKYKKNPRPQKISKFLTRYSNFSMRLNELKNNTGLKQKTIEENPHNSNHN